MFRDKVALVTGGQQGIGRGMAVAFAEAGADVAINWLDDRPAAEETVAAVARCGLNGGRSEDKHRRPRAILVQGDVSRVQDARRIVAETVAGVGRIDFLINNAGIFPRVPFLDMREEDWDRVLDVNLKGAFFCAQAAARAMIETGAAGGIVNLSSRALAGGTAHSTHYASSKAGILGLTRAMALELAPHGLRVNAIAPGLVDTAQPRYGNSEEQIAAMASAIPLGRMGQPADIADMAVFLCSDKAAWITGQVMHVNGGTYLA
jgi:NAD(P)-dependent dehydrogenase (short-subunit alcohol dehydrogenase family)